MNPGGMTIGLGLFAGALIAVVVLLAWLDHRTDLRRSHEAKIRDLEGRIPGFNKRLPPGTRAVLERKPVPRLVLVRDDEDPATHKDP